MSAQTKPGEKKIELPVQNTPVVPSPTSDQLDKKDVLSYWSELQLQLHKEVQEQLAEMTRYTNLKIVLLGALLVFAKGPIALMVFLFIPVAIYTLDLIHSLRFNHIFDRWRYIADVVAPEVRALTESTSESFAEQVMARHNANLYNEPNKLMRSLFIAPALIVASVAVGTLARLLFKVPELTAHIATLGSFAAYSIFVLVGKRYRATWILSGGLLLASLLYVDYTLTTDTIYDTVYTYLVSPQATKP